MNGRNSALLCICCLLAGPALAGPQHWGFGFGYLVLLEEEPAPAAPTPDRSRSPRPNRVLAVYEPPLRVKDSAWLLRWRDTSDRYADVLPNGIAVGNFWPKPMGTEHLACLVRDATGSVAVRLLESPEVFSTRPWTILGQSPLLDRIVPAAAAAGDLLGCGSDQLIVARRSGDSSSDMLITAYRPPADPGAGTWEKAAGFSGISVASLPFQGVPIGDCGTLCGLAAGDFRGDGADALALMFVKGETTEIIYVRNAASARDERRIAIAATGADDRLYRLYRRWEPAYGFERLAEKQASGSTVLFEDDMGAEDWFTRNRSRALYYVTQVHEGVESLPRRVIGIAIAQANGVSDMGGGRLLLSVNGGKAEPFGVICRGTTPREEFLKHFRFGHTVAKIVPKALAESVDIWHARLP